MTLFILGSINADHAYSVPRLPGPGETVAAGSLASGLGGKGANQSVAAARAGAEVVHIGAVGHDGGWAVERLAGYGVQTHAIDRKDELTTGHAVICVDPMGENQIIVYPGANRALTLHQLKTLDAAEPDDWLLLQNETNLQVEAARQAVTAGASVAYSAAPFDVDAVRAILPLIDLLLLNAVEAAQLCEALGVTLAELPIPWVVVTRGADGVDWHEGGKILSVPAHPVDVVDTTGAGDTFAGYLVAGLSQGMAPDSALRLASAAAAIQITQVGAADAIPTRAQVDALVKA